MRRCLQRLLELSLTLLNWPWFEQPCTPRQEDGRAGGVGRREGGNTASCREGGGVSLSSYYRNICAICCYRRKLRTHVFGGNAGKQGKLWRAIKPPTSPTSSTRLLWQRTTVLYRKKIRGVGGHIGMPTLTSAT